MTENEVAAGPVALGVKVTVARPLLYARPEPVSDAVPMVGALGGNATPDPLEDQLTITSSTLGDVEVLSFWRNILYR